MKAFHFPTQPINTTLSAKASKSKKRSHIREKTGKNQISCKKAYFLTLHINTTLSAKDAALTFLSKDPFTWPSCVLDGSVNLSHFVEREGFTKKSVCFSLFFIYVQTFHYSLLCQSMLIIMGVRMTFLMKTAEVFPFCLPRQYNVENNDEKKRKYFLFLWCVAATG